MDFNKLTIKSQEAIAAAQDDARRRGNPELTPDHLLLALLDQELFADWQGLRPDAEARVDALPAVQGGRQQPNASAAFTDIVLQSPDLIAWFTGPAAGFMVFLNLFMAVLPVLQVIYAHHVSHGIKDAEDYANARGAAVDRDQYAA